MRPGYSVALVEKGMIGGGQSSRNEVSVASGNGASATCC